MALVRRTAVIGIRASSEVFAAPGQREPFACGSTPTRPEPAQDWPYGGSPSAAATPRAVGVATVSTAAIGPPPPLDDAAAVASPPASDRAIVLAFGLVAAGSVVAYAISQWSKVDPYRIGNSTAAFGILFVFAAAVERLLEPVTQRLPGRRAKADYERGLAGLANRDPATSVADVAAAKAHLDQARANRTVLTWGLATAVATVVCAAGGFFLLRILAEETHWDGVATWIDALVTGLIVGSGTKPLHDVISRLQTSTEKSDDPALKH
jgi:hypothetical protein